MVSIQVTIKHVLLIVGGKGKKGKFAGVVEHTHGRDPIHFLIWAIWRFFVDSFSFVRPLSIGNLRVPQIDKLLNH